MAEDREAILSDEDILKETGAETTRFLPSDRIPIRFADAFLVGGQGDIFTINFYQTEIPEIQGKRGEKGGHSETQDAVCFARIAVSPIGIRRLLKSMANHVGYDIAKRSKESKPS